MNFAMLQGVSPVMLHRTRRTLKEFLLGAKRNLRNLRDTPAIQALENRRGRGRIRMQRGILRRLRPAARGFAN